MTPLALGLALSTLGQPAPAYPAPVVAPVAVPAVTLADFARVFAPTPGLHEAWIVHPRTGVPVFVRFALPDAAPTKVEFHPRRIEVRYRGHDVEVIFRLNGSVDVKGR